MGEIGCLESTALPWWPSGYTALRPANCGHMLSARYSYCGAGGQDGRRAACRLWEPRTSWRNTRSAPTLRTASRNSGRMKRRLNGLKPLWVFTVSTCRRGRIMRHSPAGHRATVRAPCAGRRRVPAAAGAPGVVGCAHLDVVVEVAVQVARRRRRRGVLAGPAQVVGLAAAGPGADPCLPLAQGRFRIAAAVELLVAMQAQVEGSRRRRRRAAATCRRYRPPPGQPGIRAAAR